jgi:hypothetical protein
VQAGADINAPCGPRGECRTPLHIAAEHGHVLNIQVGGNRDVYLSFFFWISVPICLLLFRRISRIHYLSRLFYLILGP